MRLYSLLLGMLFLLSACATPSTLEKDKRADSALGLHTQDQDNHDEEAQKALQEQQSQEQQNQKQALERQITDPLA